MRLGMLAWGWLLLGALLCGMVPATAGPARPAEEPPAGFAGTQFIDSTGCVFRRNGRLWEGQRLRDGTPLCGYPPTPVGAAAARPRAPLPGPPPLEGMARVEAELVAAVTADLRPGELVSDPRRPGAAASDAPAAPPRHPAPPAPEAEAGVALAAAVAAAVPVRAAVAGAGNERLCGLLGLQQATSDAAFGADPTGGLCSAAGQAALSPRIPLVEATVAAAPGTPEAGPHAGPRAAMGRNAAAPAAKPVQARVPRAGDGTGMRRKRTPDRPPAPLSLPLSAEPMIPAGARFLQVAAATDAANGAAIVARLQAMGLPAARSRGTGRPAILAGPFETRKAIVAAHDRLIRAGFRGLVPR